MKKQRPPRLQHYVPQLLLRRFARADGRLWAYDAETRKMFASAPKGLAAEGYFYGTTTKHATQKSTAIERWLSEQIEGPADPAIDGLLAKRLLSTEHIQSFFIFVAAQMQRTPASLQRATDSFAPQFQEMAERMAKYDPEFRNNVIARAKAEGNSDAEISELMQILDGGKLKVTPTRDFAIWVGFSVLERLAEELAKMQWTFFSVDPTDSELIIGDHPVTLTDVAPEGIPAGALGVKNPNIEIVMPLSPRMVALAHWDGPSSYGVLEPGMVDTINERTLRHAHRFVYAPFESEELLAQAVSVRGTGPKVRMHRIRIGEKLLMVNEFR